MSEFLFGQEILVEGWVGWGWVGGWVMALAGRQSVLFTFKSFDSVRNLTLKPINLI